MRFICYPDVIKMNNKAGYISFLLPLWRVKENHRQIWRASLEDVESGEKCGFTSLEDILVYLRQITTEKSEELNDGSVG